MHPVLGEIAKTSKKRNLHVEMRLDLLGVSRSNSPTEVNSCSSLFPGPGSSESDQDERPLVENLHMYLCPIWIPPVAGLRQPA